MTTTAYLETHIEDDTTGGTTGVSQIAVAGITVQNTTLPVSQTINTGEQAVFYGTLTITGTNTLTINGTGILYITNLIVA